MKSILFIILLFFCFACTSTKYVEHNVTYQVGDKKGYPTIQIKSPYIRKEIGALFTERATVVIDSLVVKKDDEILWNIINKGGKVNYTIEYGKVPNRFYQLFPKNHKKPAKLEKGEYIVDVYIKDENLKFIIVIE